ncbi:uncharacterized protein CYBJADRAFT_171224, partial [Cyberlindnera jadinii NRRL Y-1542]
KVVETKVVETKVEGSQTIVTTRTVTSTLAEASDETYIEKDTVDKKSDVVTGYTDEHYTVETSVGTGEAISTQAVISTFDGSAMRVVGSALAAILAGILFC